MGQQNTKILTKTVSPQQIIRKQPVQVGLYFYPFKQYSKLNTNEHSDHVILEKIKPYQDSVKVSTNFYPELQKAVFQKTFDIRIEEVFFDTFNFNRAFYRAWDHEIPITFVQRKFKLFSSQLYQSILYEKHIYETINRLDSPNLIKMNDSFCINSNLEEEYPMTYFFIFENLQVNLSEIIKYRKDNQFEWYVTEFQKLCWDLVSALDDLHQMNITHNDIRPCNVFYSTEKGCYVLGQFSNALKTDPKGTSLNIRTRNHPSFMISQKQLSSPTLRQVFVNHKRADIYSLGITLLCAFYMMQPVQRKLAAPINRNMQEKYEIMKILSKMVKKSETQVRIQEIKQDLQNCNKKSDLNYLIRSIKFRHKPKTKQLPMIYIAHASAYKRFGLWQNWRDSLESVYQIQDGNMTQIEQAEYCKQISRVQKLLENYQKSDQLGQKAANLYYEIGSKYFMQNNLTEAFDAFNKGMKALNNCYNSKKIVLVKILQILSILYSKQNQQIESLACLKESKIVLKQTYSESIQDYYEIKIKQAKIHQIHSNFNEAQKVLKELLKKSIKDKDDSGKIQFLKQLGLNSIKKAQNQKISESNSIESYMELSSPLRKSKSWKVIEQQSKLAQNQSEKQLKRQNFAQAESFFKQASELITQKQIQTHKKPGYVQQKTINKDQSQLTDNQIQYENFSIQNLLILKSLGQIKFKENQTQRAEDYFFNVLGQIDKIFDQNDQFQASKPTITNANKSKYEQSEQDGLKYEFQEESSEQTLNRTLKLKKYRQTQKGKKVQKVSTKRPQRLMSKGDLIKIKADIQCQIALCKQQYEDHKETLNYYNKSLSSYKAYYGQCHNKLCGIIIGSMALGYQKTNQHNKALECIELATEILKDIEPANSPDLQHFQKMREHLMREETLAEKRIFNKRYLKIGHTKIAQILSSILGLKMLRPKNSRKSVNFRSSMISIDLIQKIQEEQEKTVQIDECELESGQSDNGSLRQVQLPLRVTYEMNSQSLINDSRIHQVEHEISLKGLNQRLTSSTVQ